MKNIKLFLIFTLLLMTFSLSHAQNTVTIATVSGAVPGGAVQVALNAQLTTVTAGVQFTIVYDPTVLQYVSLSNFNAGMPAFYLSSNPAPGQIIFSYLDIFNFTTFSIPELSKFFDVNFICLDYVAGTSAVQFSGTPAAIEFLNGDFEEYFPILTNGGVSTAVPPATSTYSGTGNWNVFANWNNGLPGTVTNAFY